MNDRCVSLDARIQDILQDWVPERGLAGDVINNTEGLRNDLLRKQFYAEIQRVDSYEGYIRRKFGRSDDPNSSMFAEKVIVASDQVAVATYNKMVARINILVSQGVETEEQAKCISELLIEMPNIIRG